MRIEIRNDQVILDGYVNAVGRPSRVLPSPRGNFRETIVPKTFERALSKGQNVDLLFNHIKSKKLGSTSEKNLTLTEDNIGLRAIAYVTDPEVMEKAKNGELTGWSFGFFVNQDKWLDGEDGIHNRMVDDIELIEVSILDKQPAYIATSIEMRGEETALVENRIEDFVASIQDNSELKVDDKKQNEKINNPISYRTQELELTLLQMKG